MKRFGDLFVSVKPLFIRGEEQKISGLTEDSRKVRPGMVFVACRGGTHDGHHFIKEALARGAVGVVTEKEVFLPPEIAWAQVASSREALGPLAQAFYDFPAQKLTLIGVTGTNGKTSVAWFWWHLLKNLGLKTGLLGTIFYHLGEKETPAQATTPPAVKLASFLAEMVAQGCTHAVLEVSSHALDQERVGGLTFKVAAFTNLSRDHLDYHRHLEAYFQAKKKLFTSHLAEESTAVINVNDPWGRRLASEIEGKVLKIGKDLRGKILKRSFHGFLFEIEYQGQKFPLATRLVGDFQLENLLVAMGGALALGIPLPEILRALEGVSAPPGRLELVAQVSGAAVFVDYAHTPRALEMALKSLKVLNPGRLWVLFGCGGERDQGKRPEMGKVAERYADLVVLTSDNPRGEDPQEIVIQIMAGMETKPVLVELDRKKAISLALEKMAKGDILLVAGKGHEDYQEIAGQRRPFSDREVIREFLLTEAA